MIVNSSDIYSAETGIIEIDITTIVFQAVVTVAVSIGGGTLLGYKLSEWSRKKQEKEDIKKVRELVADDFQRINILLNRDIKFLLDTLESIQKDFKIIDEFFIDNFAIAKFFRKISPRYQFGFKHIIENSSLMIKLSKEEIKIIEALYDLITELTSNEEKNMNLDVEETRKIIRKNKSFDYRRLELKLELFNLILVRIYHVVGLYDEFLDLENFDWIKIERSPESQYEKAELITKMYREHLA